MSISFIGDNFESSVRNLDMYSDGTPMVKLPDYAEIVERADTIVVRTSNLGSFFTAMMLVDSVNASGGWIKTLVVPYLPGARQDRINPTGDVLPVAAAVARMINERQFSRVVALDPHSEVIAKAINNFTAYPLSKVADCFYPSYYDGIIAPDKGAKGRAQEFADALGLPIFYGGKTRDVVTGKLTGFTLERIEPGHYLVVDDICDGGGTFIGLAARIREQGAAADLYVSHGIFSKGISSLNAHFRNIYVTDSRDFWEAMHQVNLLPIVRNMTEFARRDI